MSYEQSLYKIIEPVKINTIKRLNKSKKWEYGYNKEHDPFSQLNLALVFGETSQLPLYYRKLAGNTPDVKTVKHLLVDLQNLGFVNPKLVMDKGFFSQDNLKELFKEHVKFLLQ